MQSYKASDYAVGRDYEKLLNILIYIFHCVIKQEVEIKKREF